MFPSDWNAFMCFSVVSVLLHTSMHLMRVRLRSWSNFFLVLGLRMPAIILSLISVSFMQLQKLQVRLNTLRLVKYSSNDSLSFWSRWLKMYRL